MQGTGIFVAYELHGIRLVCQLRHALAYILLMERAQHAIFLVIELLRHKDSLVAGERYWFGEIGSIDVINGSPRAIHPVCTGFQDVMLEIMRGEEQLAHRGTGVCIVAQTLPIPSVGSSKVVAAQSVIGDAFD